MPEYYPVMLDVRGRLALVIGGDNVAAEKATNLAASGAHVRVLNDTFCDKLWVLANAGRITLQQKSYEPGDTEGAFVVIASTTDPQLAEAIWAETQARGQLVNIVDTPEYCSFILPSILRREQLTVSVSTEGASPGLAKRIRHHLEELFPEAYGPYVRLAGLVREHLRRQQVSYARRDEFFRDFFASDILVQLIGGNKAQAIEITASLLHEYGISINRKDLETALGEEEERAHVNRIA